VRTKDLIQAVKRNRSRFSEDFMFRLNTEETEKMRSRIVTASKRNIRYSPFSLYEIIQEMKLSASMAGIGFILDEPPGK
jgi:hypothetical protein